MEMCLHRKDEGAKDRAQHDGDMVSERTTQLQDA